MLRKDPPLPGCVYSQWRRTHALVCTFVKDGVYPENCTLKPGAVADEECDAGWATCTEPAHCLDCKATVGEIDPDNHSWGNWKDDGNGNHVCVCWRNSAHVESRPHTGGTANCVEQAVCDECHLEYGSVDLTAHDWGEWTTEDETNHSHSCTRGNCDAKEETEKHDFDFNCTASGACSACGYVKQAQEHIHGPAANAAVQAVEPYALPQYGEWIVRLLEKPVESAAYGITVAWEAAGRALPFEGTVSVSLPLQALGAFKLMQNGAEIPFTMENGMLIFQTSDAGLFLLVAGE